ncbi:MAG: class I SAM-dependent methyltransferase [Deltaproteobacteria bacterium]|nr:class I SAM-dependent methyltransferase [Deltaproteobacteria bacterium]
MKVLKKIPEVPGMLTRHEGEYLYRLAQLDPGKGVIVEIGSWKGKSTIWLALGSTSVGGEEVYAVDPHKPLADEGYMEDTEAEFRKNINAAAVDSRVVPMVMTSEEAAKGWSKPIRLLWIDGDHRYEQVKRDFLLWEPHVVEGGIIAMHDTIRKKGPKRVLWESVFCSNRFRGISIVDNITAARKVRKTSIWGALTKWLTIGCRAFYIAARKIRIPYAKPFGRWILRRLTT